MPISLVLDIIISVLLVLTIAYAVRLNQRLVQLRSDKNELLVLAKTFASSTVRAEAAIANLKVSSESLASEVVKAEALKDDLAYLVSHDGHSADEMVDTVRGKGRAQSSRSGKSQNAPRRSRPAPEVDSESKLIEEAIRAATPGPGQGDDEAQYSKADTTNHAKGNTRRITGLLGAKSERQASAFEDARSVSRSNAGHSETRMPSSRDLNSGFEDDEGSIGDTDAARELLKALGSVK
ncbi:MAG: hypothetical protein COB59_05375 [Rhodospirillaceae bacterium]|nr:MAG: hypothetical protein COB59_05375 [Rhodospirillaceae bacterium]